MKTIISFISGFTQKMLIVYSITFATIIDLLETITKTYIWSDWKYVGFLATIVIVDTITGTIASKFGRKEQITSQKMQGMMIKVILYLCYLISINIALNFTINGNRAAIFDYLTTVLYAYPVMRELISIDENMMTMGYSIFPRWFREKIQEMIDKKTV